ncbi:MAG TPA: hypothetical protein VGK97_13920, partial [Spongiibacteraceae bacterium]
MGDILSKKIMAATLMFGLYIVTSASAQAGECENWQTAHPSWLWCDDFESTSALTQRYEDVNTNGMSVIAGNGLNGSQGLTQHYTKGQVDAGWIVKYKAAGFPDHVFYRYYHKFDAGFTTFPPKMSRIGYRNHSTWEEVFRVHSWLTNTGTVDADAYAKNSTQANSTGWLPITYSNFSFGSHLNEWVAIEVELKLNTAGKSDGLYRTWINDQLVIERLNIDMRGTTADKINEVM